MVLGNVKLVKFQNTSSLGNLSTDTVITTFSDLPESVSIALNLSSTSVHESSPNMKIQEYQKFTPWQKYEWSKTVIWCIIVFPLICFVIWSMTYILFGNLALPGGSLFALAILELLAIVLGHTAEFIKLPPLVGMTLAGLFLRNFPTISNIGKNLDLSVTNPLRAMSVVVLLTRGALNVNPTLIRRHKWVIPQLYIGSCIFEAIAGCIAAYFLFGFPVQWAVAVGCIFSAMSGAAVMPYLLKFENEGVGLEHSVLEITKQGSGLDAILAICLTELAFGFIFAAGDLAGGIKKGLLEVIMGGAFGTLWGGLAGIFLEQEHESTLRTFAVFSGGSLGLLGLTKIGYPRGGPLACFLGTFICCCIWRQKKMHMENLSRHLTILWYLFQPLLFGIIGSRIDLNTVDWNIILQTILCFTISISVRMCASFSMLCLSEEMTTSEKLFVVLAWLPKGTVQAALGPVILETAINSRHGAEMESMGYNVLCIATTVALLASIIGALALLIFGRRLLSK